MSELVYAAIVGARRRLWLATSYFNAGRAFVDALCDASRRGVDVQILVAGRHIDKKVVRQSAQRGYARLLESAVRVFEYDKTMLHAKTLIVDDDWADLGSSNFNHRSFALDAELNVSVFDAGVVTELEHHFLELTSR